MTDEVKIAVLGCGNIGSRHLQGLARLDRPARIVACDPSGDSRRIAAERVAEAGPGPHLAFAFVDDPEALPDRIDLAIVATGAAPRGTLVRSLLESREVRALILEKFLFQTHADHVAIGDLIARQGLPAFVNTPRRAWPVYRRLAAELAGQGPLTVTVDLNRTNGLATNAIHFVDLAAFLAGVVDGFSLDGSRLVPVDGVSRHAGTVDFAGLLSGVSARGDLLALRGRTDSTAPHVVVLTARDRRLLIDEVHETAWVADAETDWQPRRIDFPILRQSALTGRLASDILDTGSCDLPGYEESALLHRRCLAAFLQAIGRDPEDATAVAPVT